MKTPPSEVQPPIAAPTAARPLRAEQQQSWAATSRVAPPPLLDQILQAYHTHDFELAGLQGDLLQSNGSWCRRDRDRSRR